MIYILGVDCVIVKSGRRICGTGAALANSPLVQDKSYFEVKIQCEGMFTVHTHIYIYTHYSRTSEQARAHWGQSFCPLLRGYRSSFPSFKIWGNERLGPYKHVLFREVISIVSSSQRVLY